MTLVPTCEVASVSTWEMASLTKSEHGLSDMASVPTCEIASIDPWHMVSVPTCDMAQCWSQSPAGTTADISWCAPSAPAGAASTSCCEGCAAIRYPAAVEMPFGSSGDSWSPKPRISNTAGTQRWAFGTFITLNLINKLTNLKLFAEEKIQKYGISPNLVLQFSRSDNLKPI